MWYRPEDDGTRPAITEAALSVAPARISAQPYQARAAEYAELGENVERLQDEIRRETRKERFTFAALGDIESDWDKVQRWLSRIRARDFFATTAHGSVEQLLAEAQHELQTFTDPVYAQQANETETT